MSLFEYALFSFGSLFIIIDPIAAVPAFLTMTARESVPSRLRTARTACIVAVGILAGFGLAGPSPFYILGITMPAFQIAAALVLLLVALDMFGAKIAGAGDGRGNGRRGDEGRCRRHAAGYADAGRTRRLVHDDFAGYAGANLGASSYPILVLSSGWDCQLCDVYRRRTRRPLAESHCN